MRAIDGDILEKKLKDAITTMRKVKNASSTTAILNQQTIAVTGANKMSDLIDRHAAYEVLTAYYHHKTDIQHAALHEALNRIPTVRARWEYVDYGGIGNWHCSVCRAISHKRTNFCPTCGRDMRGDYQ